jgi:hypothetical protein
MHGSSMRHPGLATLAFAASFWFVGDAREVSAVEQASERTQALPRWRVEVVGECHGVHPEELDASCHLVAVSPMGQEVYFSLEKQWLEGGQLYLEDLLEQITPKDLVAIYAEVVLTGLSRESPVGFKEDGCRS